jgi:hypothetical protein
MVVELGSVEVRVWWGSPRVECTDTVYSYNIPAEPLLVLLV